jgi:hypothetical protein
VGGCGGWVGGWVGGWAGGWVDGWKGKLDQVLLTAIKKFYRIGPVTRVWKTTISCFTQFIYWLFTYNSKNGVG